MTKCEYCGIDCSDDNFTTVMIYWIGEYPDQKNYEFHYCNKHRGALARLLKDWRGK